MQFHAPAVLPRAAADLAVQHGRSIDASRLRVYIVIAWCRLIYLFGGSWDIQWHITVGRDDLLIPPHLVAGFGFVVECALVLALLLAESWRSRGHSPTPHAIRIGAWSAPLPVWGILLGYVSALAAIGADDLWHRAFGLDAQLWSPPHLALMTATASADAWLLVGLATTARRLKHPLALGTAWSWAFVLVAAYLVDVVSFAASEAFLVSTQQAGRGLSNSLYPLLVGSIMPLPLLLLIGLAGRFSVVLPVFVMAVLLQFAGLGLAELGFALLRPTSNLEAFVSQNRQSTIALTRAALAENGFSRIGLQQIWMFWLSAGPFLLVAALDRWRWARKHPLVAAPVYSAGLLLSCILWFPFVPTAARYPLMPAGTLLTLVLSVSGGMVFGALGQFWAAHAISGGAAERYDYA